MSFRDKWLRKGNVFVVIFTKGNTLGFLYPIHLYEDICEDNSREVEKDQVHAEIITEGVLLT